MFGSDDDTDFLAVNGSKLAKLFPGAQAVEDGNATFTYAAPRQPKKGILKEESQSPSGSPSLPPLSSSPAQPANKLSIIIVKAVHTFLLENGKYNPQGKLGAALLGNSSIHVYQLLLYKGKQHHVSSTPITSDFQFTVQANNYSTFYTDKGQNWSLHFEGSADAEEFARQVGIARANSIAGCDGVQSLVTQVLSVPLNTNEPPANAGDTMEIFYTVKTYSAGKLGSLVESNCDATKPQRVKIRQHVWEEGLIGAAKGTKRMILLPPTLLGPWKSAVPEGTCLAVEVESSRLKQAKVSIVQAPLTPSGVLDSTESALDSSTDDQSIKARGASISEALTNSPKTHKASIISRMARMGQATLPLKGAITCNPSDSEETGDESSVASIPVLPFKTSKSRTAKPRSSLSHQPAVPVVESQPAGVNLGKNALPPQQVAVFQSMPGNWQQQQHGYSVGQFPVGQFQSGDGQYYGPFHSVSSHQIVPSTSAPAVTHQVYASPSASAISSPTSEISVFLSESRMHNTEVRMAVTKVADKVDLLLGKFEAAQPIRQNYSGTILDPSNLLASVQKIVSENESLQVELADKRNKLECQNERIFQLLNANHQYLEKNSSSSTDRESIIAKLKEDNAQLLTKLAEANAKVCELETNVDSQTINMTALLKDQQSESDERKSHFSFQETQMVELRAQLTEAMESNKAHEDVIFQLNESMREMNASKEKLDEGLQDLTKQLNQQKREAEEQANIITAQYTSQIQELEEQVEGAKCKNEALIRAPVPAEPDLVISEVKRVMNAVWKSLQAKFDSTSSYDSDVIKLTLMTTIRDVTTQFVDMKTADKSLVRAAEKVNKAVPNEVADVPLTKSVDNQNSVQRHAMAPLPVDTQNKGQEHPRQELLAVDSIVPDVHAIPKSSSMEYSKSKIIENTDPNQPTEQLPIKEEDPSVSAADDTEGWRPQPPPPPLFDDDEDDDDWLA